MEVDLTIEVAMSAVVCTHNPRSDHMERVLYALCNQSLAKDHWELVVIDNASDCEVEAQFEKCVPRNGRFIRLLSCHNAMAHRPASGVPKVGAPVFRSRVVKKFP